MFVLLIFIFMLHHPWNLTFIIKMGAKLGTRTVYILQGVNAL
jgi:hypothetical protein